MLTEKVTEKNTTAVVSISLLKRWQPVYHPIFQPALKWDSVDRLKTASEGSDDSTSHSMLRCSVDN